MTDEELKLVRIKYKDLMREHQKLEAMEIKLEELESKHINQEYVELKDSLSFHKTLYYCMLSDFSKMISSTDKSNEILIYIGQFKYNTSGTSDRVESNGDFALYRDLETLRCYRVKSYHMKKFESLHNIIRIPQNKANNDPYEEGFNELREEFFKELINKSQEETVSDLFNKRGYMYKKVKE